MKVLIIEDSELIREMLKDCVEQAGHEVIAAVEDGEEGIIKLKSLKPYIVLLDLTLPNMNGIEWLEAKNKYDEFMKIPLQEKAKVIVCSALEYKEVVNEAMKLGAVDYITKPFNEQEVIHKLKFI
jgi:two-component system, chemotaxis family, chemotaxis protein CheY